MLITLIPNMAISDYLMNKFLTWQADSKELKTVTAFGNLMGIDQEHMSLYIRGKRSPNPKHKKLIFEYFGDEAVVAFGEDPDFYALQKNWDYMTPENRRALREQSDENAKQNIQRSPKKRRVRTP